MLRRALGSLLSLTLLAPAILAQDQAPLPRGLSPEERAYIQQHPAEYLRSKRSQGTTRAPLDVMPAPGEFEPVEGILFAWNQFTSTLTGMVKEVAKRDTAFIVVASSSAEAGARQQLTGAGVEMSHVRFVRAATNSVWIRDYGPNFVYTKDGDREIVDLVYNRPRPTDDAFPSKLGPQLQLKVNKSGLILPGGNIIFDGQGAVILTDMVFDGSEGADPDLTREQLAKYMKDYFGVSKVIILEHMLEDGTGHVDMFSKLLNEDTFIVGEYAKPEDGVAGNYEILNRNAELLRTETNGAGRPFKVFRIPMPPCENGISYTHTNSTMLNDEVLVPVYGQGTDEAALAVYRSLLPGYEVVGIDANDPISSNGALHCISHELNGDPFVIDHVAVANASAGSPILITAKLVTHKPVDPGTVLVYWRAGTAGAFQTAPLAAEAEVAGTYTGEIPAQAAGTTIQYYLRAEDVRGMYETSPEDASESNTYAVKVAPPTL